MEKIVGDFQLEMQKDAVLNLRTRELTFQARMVLVSYMALMVLFLVRTVMSRKSLDIVGGFVVPVLTLLVLAYIHVHQVNCLMMGNCPVFSNVTAVFVLLANVGVIAMAFMPMFMK
jgi:hypothetical protein